MPTRSTVLSLLFAFAAAVLPAQDWRTEKVADVGVAFDAPSRLERLPMKIGDDMLYQRARLRPKDDADYVRAQYHWTCDVLEFRKTPPKDEDIKVPEGLPEGLKERFKELLRSRKENPRHLEQLGGESPADGPRFEPAAAQSGPSTVIARREYRSRLDECNAASRERLLGATPAPGAVALLGMAGLLGGSRRRRA